MDLYGTNQPCPEEHALVACCIVNAACKMEAESHPKREKEQSKASMRERQMGLSW
jgi:hypothetical protein